MTQMLADAASAHRMGDAFWLSAYACIGLLLALPASSVAMRRGLRAGVLSGVVTAAVLAILGLAIQIVLVAIFGGGSFGVGFGEAILLTWMALFLTPALLLGLIFAAVARWLSARSGRATISRRPSNPEC